MDEEVRPQRVSNTEKRGIEMRIPAFTAECSLWKTIKPYHSSMKSSSSLSARALPQARSVDPLEEAPPPEWAWGGVGRPGGSGSSGGGGALDALNRVN